TFLRMRSRDLHAVILQALPFAQSIPRPSAPSFSDLASSAMRDFRYPSPLSRLLYHSRFLLLDFFRFLFLLFFLFNHPLCLENLLLVIVLARVPDARVETRRQHAYKRIFDQCEIGEGQTTFVE